MTRFPTTYSALLAAILLLTPGCAVGRYLGYRGMDLTDIVDLKYGVAIGVGAKVEATQFIGTGAGAAALGYSREWFGRRSMELNGFAFLHLIAMGVDGGYGSMNLGGWSDERAEVYFLLVNATAFADFGIAPGGDARWDHLDTAAPPKIGTIVEELKPPTEYLPVPALEYWRFGFEVLVPGGQFGLYLNFGEVYDFMAGLITYDPADDDGVSFLATYNIPPEIVELEVQEDLEIIKEGQVQ